MSKCGGWLTRSSARTPPFRCFILVFLSSVSLTGREGGVSAVVLSSPWYHVKGAMLSGQRWTVTLLADGSRAVFYCQFLGFFFFFFLLGSQSSSRSLIKSKLELDGTWEISQPNVFNFFLPQPWRNTFYITTQDTHIQVHQTDTKVSQNDIYSYYMQYFLILSILFCSIKHHKMLVVTHQWVATGS